MEDDPLAEIQVPPTPLARGIRLLFRVWARVASPAGTRLLAPLLAAVAVYIFWRLWRLAGRSAPGRALRWHTVFIFVAIIAGSLLYLFASPPEDVTEAATARAVAAEGVGRPIYPEPLVIVGAIVTALTSFAALSAAWRWRTPSRDLLTVGAEMRRWRARYGRHTTVLAAGLTGGALAIGLALIVVGSLAPAAFPEAGSGGGSLWVGTPRGAARLTAAGWELIRRPRVPLPSNIVNDVAGGTQGDVWLATDGGLLRIDSRGGFQRVLVENAPLPYPTVLGLAVDRSGIAWAATGAGGAGIDRVGGGRAFSARNAPLLHQLLDAVAVDRDGLVWFGGAGGVNVYQPATGWASPGRWPAGFNRASTAGGLPGNVVFAIFEDSKGRMWFGTDAGAAVFMPDRAAFALGSDQPDRWLTMTTSRTSLVSDGVHAIAEDASGRIYLGTKRGVSAYEEAGSGPPRWTSIEAEKLPHPHVEAIAVSPDGRIWLGTKGGLAVYDPGSPGAALQIYQSHPLRRWTSLLWAPHANLDLPASEITALAWIP